MEAKTKREPKISLIVESDSVHLYDDITFEDCLRALVRLDYPQEKIQYILIDGGKISDFSKIVHHVIPAAEIFRLPGGNKFQQKNLGIERATGEIIAFIDGDCAPPENWLRIIVDELMDAPQAVAGVQGMTRLTRKPLSRELSALFYGPRTNHDSGYTERLVTDNCAFRKEILQRFRFERDHFSTVSDTLLLLRLKKAGYKMRFCERLVMMHSFPGWNRDGLGWFFGRAFGVGYYMVQGRRVESALRGSSLIRPFGIGWPLLSAGKTILDFKQLWQNRTRLQSSFLAALPLAAVYEAVLFCGGCAAIFNLKPPRWS
jgi:cellulose synthase/poly-beta-1,6-N-acetylglucosamine synthase-like glycosyltransferase